MIDFCSWRKERIIMKNDKKLHFGNLVACVLIIAVIILFIYLNGPTTTTKVTNFEECVAAGYLVMETYPRQCKTPDGRIFDEIIPVQENTCQNKLDCVPTTCCHANSCINRNYKPDCKDIGCSAVCEPGTMDCSQGYCDCVKNECKAILLNVQGDPFGVLLKGASLNCGPEYRYKFDVTINSKDDFVNFIKNNQINQWVKLDNFKDDPKGEVNWNKVLTAIKTEKIASRTVYVLDNNPQDCSGFTLKMTNDGYVSVYGCCGV